MLLIIGSKMPRISDQVNHVHCFCCACFTSMPIQEMTPSTNPPRRMKSPMITAMSGPTGIGTPYAPQFGSHIDEKMTELMIMVITPIKPIPNARLKRITIVLLRMMRETFLEELLQGCLL